VYGAKMLDISISSVGKPKRYGNSWLATNTRQKRLKEALVIFTDKKYLNHNKKTFGQSMLTNLWNEGFAIERMLKGREVKIG
jgi:hypothetical protein